MIVHLFLITSVTTTYAAPNSQVLSSRESATPNANAQDTPKGTEKRGGRKGQGQRSRTGDNSQTEKGAAADRTKRDPLAGAIGGLSARTIGPSIASGRISSISVNPNNRSEYFISVASGGVWKTTNAGTTWTPVFDNEASYSIACVVIDPRNPNTVWVGSGENNSQRSVGYGDGVYRSDDGGRSWRNVGLQKSEHIGKILIDPRDSNTVYVAAQGPLWGPGGDRGLYKTTDGGKNWSLILNISENTGVSDVVLDPRNPDVLIALPIKDAVMFGQL